MDLVIGAGDFGAMRQGIAETIVALSEIECPAVLVPGNSESQEELAEACRSWSSAYALHGTGATIDGIDFWGVGAAIPGAPFGDWSYDFSEEEGRQLWAECPAGVVAVSHSPPQGVLDQSSSGNSLGSIAVREAVERVRPLLVVCGHIHDCGGRIDNLDDTPVVNAGPRGIVRELPR